MKAYSIRIRTRKMVFKVNAKTVQDFVMQRVIKQMIKGKRLLKALVTSRESIIKL
ncbi:unknown [Salmonella phage FelixO1]|uniref:Uncharacterized protein n=1 Tax=Salmonella phage Felix O1 (isolate Felix O1-VT1) TaxID=1283336 RepID=Q6KGK7_BPFO1|nr:unknown [Salmonella phage FelixO1]